MPELGEIVAAMDEWYPPAWAESWDAVGLVCGELDAPVQRVLLAIDAIPAVLDEAEATGAQLLLTHHPLLLTAVHGVPAADPKGGLVHRMIRAGIAHLVAHTNAEAASPGVSDALAAVLGLADVEPLEPLSAALARPGDRSIDKLVVYVPVDAADGLVDALSASGAGRLGDYDRCAWTSVGAGTFRAGPGAHPAIGTIGEITRVEEARIEMIVPAAHREEVLRSLRAAHPYEEPAFDLLVRREDRPPAGDGVGRIGTLPGEMTLRDFTRLVADRLPATAGGVRAAGDPDRPVRRVAVLGGSGSSLIDTARKRGADVYLTADLKHHNAVEAVTQLVAPSMALVDAAHWATERPWLDALARRFRDRFGTTVVVVASDVVTDPWHDHQSSAETR